MKKLSQWLVIVFPLVCFFESYGASKYDKPVLFQLSVREIYKKSCKDLTVFVRPSDTIENVKEQLKEKSQIPADKQYLMNSSGHEVNNLEDLYQNDERFFLLLNPSEAR